MSYVHPAFLAKLVRSIAILALPCEGQVAWLSSLEMGEPDCVDELVLELEEGVRLSRQFEEAGWLRPEVRKAIVDIDALLADRSGSAERDFWSLDALRSSPDWVRIRKLALDVLIAL